MLVPYLPLPCRIIRSLVPAFTQTVVRVVMVSQAPRMTFPVRASRISLGLPFLVSV